MTRVTILEAKANLSELVQEALSGEEVMIVEDDKPLIKLVSVLEKTKPKKRRIGGARGVVTFMAEDFDAPLEDFEAYMQTKTE